MTTADATSADRRRRALLVADAERTIRVGSKSFRMASRLFDRNTRERAWLLYAWCRYCDDCCDGQELGFAARAPAETIDALRQGTWRAIAGEETGQVAFDGLGQLLRECTLPRQFLMDHLDGFALDAKGWRPQDEQDLVDYCYRVAGAVGCMMAVVMGVPPEDEDTLARAADLGIAFQLSNIARDVADDHALGRCYLPSEWMQFHGVDAEDPLRPDRRDALVRLVRQITDLSATYEASAEPGISRLPLRSRWAILAAQRIYGGIGRRVAALGPDAWNERVAVPRAEKLRIMVGAFAAAALRRS